MTRDFAAVATVVGLLLAVSSGHIVLAAIGVALLGTGAAVILRHPEWAEE